MQSRLIRPFAAAIVVAAVACGLVPGQAFAARVAVISNNYENETAANFNTNISSHTFTPIDASVSVPTLTTLLQNYDVLLVFEDTTYGNATAVGDVVAAFAQAGGGVVLGTFYDQERSDGAPAYGPHGWGALEQIDPNTTDGTGTAYSPRSLDVASIVPGPLTAGVTSLFASRFAGGNQAKPGTIVVANWAQKNAQGGADPAIAYRITSGACVIHVAIAPQYPSVGTANVDWGGDFYRVWRNAFTFGANHCAPGPPPGIPTLSTVALALTALLLVALVAFPRVRARR